MNVKHAFIILLLFLILASAVTMVSADDDKSYTIDNALINLTIHSNGLLHVEENLKYSFKGSYNGVYRDIPLKQGESIENIKVSADGAYTALEQSDEDGFKHLKIYLYSDKGHTKGIQDRDVTVHIRYDMKNTVTLFNDAGGLQYKVWGDGWDVGVGKVVLNVKMPGKTGNQYYLDPAEYNSTGEIKGDTITAESKSIPKNTLYELLVIMPLSDFDKNAANAKHIDSSGKDMIIKNHNDSINSRNFWNTTWLILGLLTLLGPVIALLTYLKFGREPEVEYDGIYEREPPSDDSPEVVNAIYATGNIGKPDMDGFEACILNLIDKKVLKLSNVYNEDTETNDLYIEFSEDTSDLKAEEKDVYDILYNFSYDNILNLSALNTTLSNESDARWFMEQYHTWQENVENDLTAKVENEFVSTGASIIKIFAGIGVVYGIIIGFFGFITDLPNGRFALYGGVFIFIFSLILLRCNDDTFGHWSSEGREIYLKWKNFKKFLNDNSLIKEHPPESIVIWRKYLIYGAALGIADKVYENMKLYETDFDFYNDDIFLYHHYGGYYMMHNAIITGEHVSMPSTDGSDFGNFGGGSGGGGGGAF